MLTTDNIAATQRPRPIWPAVWLAFGLLAAVLVVRALASGGMPLFADTDDAMRLAVVQDLVSGQGWFDPFQHRLNAPFGADMHWSRLVDLPIAALVLLFRPLFGPDAGIVAAHVWPLLLLFGLLALSALLTLELAGRDALLPALLLPALAVVTLVEFAPGRIDHHSVGILLTLGMLYCCVRAPARPRFAIGAGIAAATALAVAIENLPAVAAAILACGLTWVLMPGRADVLRGFGLALAATTLALAGLTLSPERWLVPACDSLSAVYLLAALGVGVTFLLLSLLRLQSAWVRLALGAAAGGGLAVGLALAFPACLAGPYADLDPWLAAYWMDRVSEAKPLWASLAGTPAYVVAAVVPTGLALAACAWRLRFGGAEGRNSWLVYGLFLALAAAVMLVQARGARVAAGLAIPAGAWLILAARRRYLARPGVAQIAGLAGSWLGFAGIAIAALATLAIPPAQGGGAGQAGQPAPGLRQACLMQSSYAPLEALPPTRIMSLVDLGAHVLAFTRHEVVAAPYHRNQQGIRDALEVFNGPVDAARAILARRGIGLVVVCAPMPEMRATAGAAADSFVRLHAQGALPEWLVKRSADGAPLEIYEIAP